MTEESGWDGIGWNVIGMGHFWKVFKGFVISAVSRHFWKRLEGSCTIPPILAQFYRAERRRREAIWINPLFPDTSIFTVTP